jgi:hypothetical protein
MPVAAAFGALASLVCCLPFGIAAAAALAGAGALLSPVRPWLLGASAVFLGVGVYQVYFSSQVCRRRSTSSVVVLWLAAAVVVGVALFPQLLAAALADWVS